MRVEVPRYSIFDIWDDRLLYGGWTQFIQFVEERDDAIQIARYLKRYGFYSGLHVVDIQTREVIYY